MSGTRVELYHSDRTRIVVERFPKENCGLSFLEEKGIDPGHELILIADNYIMLTWCQALTDLITLDMRSYLSSK